MKNYLLSGTGGIVMFEDEMNEPTICKYCGGTALYGDFIWLNGKCMCPKCYMLEKAKEDNKRDN